MLLLLEAQSYVYIGIKGYRYAGMPKPFLNNLWVYPLLKHKAGVDMTRIMKPDIFYAYTFYSFPPGQRNSIEKRKFVPGFIIFP